MKSERNLYAVFLVLAIQVREVGVVQNSKTEKSEFPCLTFLLLTEIQENSGDIPCSKFTLWVEIKRTQCVPCSLFSCFAKISA